MRRENRRDWYLFNREVTSGALSPSPQCQLTARRRGQRMRPRFASNYSPQDLRIASTVAAKMHDAHSPCQRPLPPKSPPSTLLLPNNQNNCFLLSGALYCSDKCQLANLGTSHGIFVPDYDLNDQPPPSPLGIPVPHDTPITLSLTGVGVPNCQILRAQLLCVN